MHESLDRKHGCTLEMSSWHRASCFGNQYHPSQTVPPEDKWAQLTVGETTSMVWRAERTRWVSSVTFSSVQLPLVAPNATCASFFLFYISLRLHSVSCGPGGSHWDGLVKESQLWWFWSPNWGSPSEAGYLLAKEELLEVVRDSTIGSFVSALVCLPPPSRPTIPASDTWPSVSLLKGSVGHPAVRNQQRKMVTALLNVKKATEQRSTRWSMRNKRGGVSRLLVIGEHRAPVCVSLSIDSFGPTAGPHIPEGRAWVGKRLVPGDDDNGSPIVSTVIYCQEPPPPRERTTYLDIKLKHTHTHCGVWVWWWWWGGG